MRVAVVILNWNGKNFLEQFLPTVIKHSEDATIYVADNGSTDGSVAFLRKDFPSVQLIELTENHGFAGGYNKALSGLSEAYFVLLNSDIEVTENWLKPIVRLMDSDSSIAACQPKILAFDNKQQFEYAGAAGGYIDRFGYPFCRGRIFDTLETDSGQYDDIAEVFWATGACLFVRREAYEEVGGLDEDFFAHMEEIDLCWRLKRADYKIMVQPESVVYHVGGGTLSRSNPHKTYLNFRNGLSLLLKNLPKRGIYTKLFVRMVLDGVAAFKFLLSGQPKDFWAVLRAHTSFYISFQKNINKRSGIYSKQKQIFEGSMVIQYFLKKRRRFSDLPSNRF